MPIYKELVQKISISPDKKTKQKDYLNHGSVAVIDQGQQLIGGYTNDDNMVVSCDLPVIVFGDHTRVVKYISFPFGAGADGIKVLQPKENILPKFLYYATQYLVLTMEDRGYARHYQYLEKKEIDVPSISEQERIVARIEELFSQLDNGVETLKKTKQQLAVFRQAVLKEAFENIESLLPIREMSTLVTSGSRGWAQYYSLQGAKFIRIGNLTRDSIDINFSDTQYVDLPDQAEGLRSKLQPNDVLISITADLGSIGLTPHDIGDAYINQHIAVVRFKNPKQGKFMAWYLRSEKGQKDLLKNKRGAGKLGLGLDDIRDSKVPVVSDEEAAEVLSVIESRLSVCDNIERIMDDTLQQAEAMRQSILKKEFEEDNFI